MGPQWHRRRDRENSLLGHSGCRVGGNDLDIATAFKSLMPLLGMGANRKGIALPILPWWNAIAINDVPAQSDFTAPPTAASLTIWCAMPGRRKGRPAL